MKKCKNYLCADHQKSANTRCKQNPDGNIENCECRNDDPSKIKILDGGCVVKKRNG